MPLNYKMMLFNVKGLWDPQLCEGGVGGVRIMVLSEYSIIFQRKEPLNSKTGSGLSVF